MDDKNLDDTVRDALEDMRFNNKDCFRPAELAEYASELKNIPSKKIVEALDRLWADGYPIYCNTMGATSNQLWEFGLKPARKPVSRRPIGR